MRFSIHKSTRFPAWPYCGPACEATGVEPGKIYNSREEAEQDAARLTAHNPVGFSVFEIPSEKSV